MPSPALEFIAVNYRYPRARQWALADINLSVQKGSFVVLAGPTGSGKSTLLRIARGLQSELGGELRGNITVLGEDIVHSSASHLGSKIAIVFQNPAYQLLQPRVVDEIMSSPIYQGLPWADCVALAELSAEEILNSELLERNPAELSTGQQQKVALAAALAMRAEILLLDEPFSYLDAVAAEDFLEVLKRLKSKGITIVLSTHRFESVAALADRIVLLAAGGHLVADGPPAEVLYSHEFLTAIGHPLFVKVGNRLLQEGLRTSPLLGWEDLNQQISLIESLRPPPNASVGTDQERPFAIEIFQASFSYQGGLDALRNVSINIGKSEVLGIIGRNGSGKTTLAKMILGLLRPSFGTVRILGKEINQISAPIGTLIGYVTQNPSDMLFETTVARECRYGPTSLGMSDPELLADEVLSKLGLIAYKERDPHSLSGGEQRLLTIADVLVNNPAILILDEPEFGLDLKTWSQMTTMIRNLQNEGKTIILIMQNLEDAVFACDRVAVLKEGAIIGSRMASELSSDRNLLEQSGLGLTPFLSILRFFPNRSDKPLTEETFIDGIVNRLRRVI